MSAIPRSSLAPDRTPLRVPTGVSDGPDTRPRFLSEADCHDIAQRLARAAQGGGYTTAAIWSRWRGNVRWARNQVSTSGEDRNDHVSVSRNLRGARNAIELINRTTDPALVAAARRAERLARLRPEEPDYDLILRYEPEPFVAPSLFVEATYQVDAEQRAAAARQLAQSAADAGMLSAGYLEVSAHSVALITSYGYTRYFQYTWAQYSVTVRDPQGTGSGWAGVDWPDWTKIDGATLSALALEKCLTSRHPVAIEPGRYTTILEPQAVNDFVGLLMSGLDRVTGSNTGNEQWAGTPFNKTQGEGGEGGFSRLGERVIDERLTISADPMDPELGFPPFATNITLNEQDPVAGDVYHPVTWIERGVLTNLAYPRKYAIQWLGRATGLPNSYASRISVTGPTTAVAQMIAETKRGLLVTRFDQVTVVDAKSILCRGYTRDGLWLIENGQISKAVKNLMFVESVVFALNNIEQLGVPQRVFHPADGFWASAPSPRIVPAMQVKDFSFTALADAV